MNEKEIFTDLEKNNWFILADIPSSHFLVSVEPMMDGFCNTDKTSFTDGAVATRSIIKSEKGREELIFIKEDFEKGSEILFNKILNNVEWAFWLNSLIEKTGSLLFKESKKLLKTNFNELSNSQLGKTYEKWGKIRADSQSVGQIWNILEFQDLRLSKFLQDYLSQKIKENKLSLTVFEVFSILSSPLKKTFAKLEEEQMLELAILAKEGKNIDSELEAHWREYCWLPYVYVGPSWKKDYFEEVLNGLKNQPMNELKEKYEVDKNYSIDLRKKQLDLHKKLKIDEKHWKLLELAQEIVFLKSYRKDSTYYGFYCAEKLFKECAKRLNITVKQLGMLLPWEVKPALALGSCDSNTLNDRHKFSIVYYRQHDQKAIILTGETAKKAYEKLRLPLVDVSNVKEIKGDCACPGKATGTIKLIIFSADMKKMKQGDILLSMATTPDIVPAMKKAGAIITDMGGLTCHAAIVSRELKIPCVIGTKFATKVLKDGDVVEVDATNGVIRKI